MTYQEFIDNILTTRGRFACGEEYHERHHITPKCMDGGNEEENLIDLYPQEHYEAHRLLFEENRHNRGLAHAWQFLSQKDGIRVTAEEYAEMRKSIALLNRGEGNPMYGKNAWDYMPEETKVKCRERLRELKLGTTHTEEEKRKIGDAHRGKIVKETTREKLRQYAGERSSVGGKHHYNNGIVEVVASECPDGFVPGRLPGTTNAEWLGGGAWWNDGVKNFFVHRGEEVPNGLAKGQIRDMSNNRKKIRCIETGVVYESISDAAITVGVSVSNIVRVLKGKRNKSGGFRWEYVKEAV